MYCNRFSRKIDSFAAVTKFYQPYATCCCLKNGTFKTQINIIKAAFLEVDSRTKVCVFRDGYRKCLTEITH